MRIVVATHALVGFGGTETYVLTLGDHLQRLGHEVWITAAELGGSADSARSRGLRVVPEPDLPREVDAVVSNLTDVAYDLVARYPGSRHLYVCHGIVFNVSTPPTVGEGPGRVVAMNDRVRGWLSGVAGRRDVVRLRQPVDLDRFFPRGAVRDRPRHLLLLGNYAHGVRRRMVEDVCSDLGIETHVAGAMGIPTDRPEDMIDAADIVLGYGRAIVEAMACGRAAYVYDRNGGDGWVTPESYPRLEADGFGGQATDAVVDANRLRVDLEAYRPEMGMLNRDLAVVNHAAHRHAAAMVEALDGAERGSADREAPWRELARMVRAHWSLEQQLIGHNHAATGLHIQIADLEAKLESAVSQANDVAARADAAEQRLAQAQALEAEAAAFRQTRRYRLAAALARPLDAVRRRGG